MAATLSLAGASRDAVYELDHENPLLRLNTRLLDHLLGLHPLLIEERGQLRRPVTGHQTRAAVTVILDDLGILQQLGDRRGKLFEDRLRCLQSVASTIEYALTSTVL